MPTRNDQVSLAIGGAGLLHRDWTRYTIDSDLMIPADAWQVTLAQPGEYPDAVVEDAYVQLRVGKQLAMHGNIDEIDDAVSRGRHDLTISGRDGAGILLDCSAPIFAAKKMLLKDVVESIVKPLGVSRVEIRAAEPKRLVERINVEPGDTAWNCLMHAAEANGLWPWFEPDGTLVVGGPDYSVPPVASLIMRKDGIGNNIESLSRKRSIAGRYSVVTVLGQAPGDQYGVGKHAIAGSQQDTGVVRHRPKTLCDYEAVNRSTAEARARKFIADSRLKGHQITIMVKGHHAADGMLWQPGQRVHVYSEPQGIDDYFFLMGRRFTGGRGVPTQTQLRLVEDGIWVLDAHPHKRKHRRGKNDSPGNLIPLEVK